MKKLLSVLLALVLVCSMAVTAFAAETPNVTLTADKDSVTAGETVTVTLKIDQDVSNLLTYEFYVFFDASLVEVTGSAIGSASNLTVVSDPGTLGGKDYVSVNGLSTLGDAVALKAGTIVTITFKANAEITGTEEAAFEVTVEALTDYDDYSEKASSASGTSVTIKMAPHDCVWDEGEVTKEATCEEAGEKTYKCTVKGCTETKTEEIPATGHTWDEGEVTKEATCEEAGEKTYTCACGETKTEEIPATGHTWDEGEVTKEATCEEAGEKTYTCECGETKTEEIPATGHTWDEGVVTKEPTTEAEGEKTYTCACGETKTEVIAKLPTGGSDLPSDSPETGDSSLIIVCVIALLVSAAAVAVLSAKKKLFNK